MKNTKLTIAIVALSATIVVAGVGAIFATQAINKHNDDNNPSSHGGSTEITVEPTGIASSETETPTEVSSVEEPTEQETQETGGNTEHIGKGGYEENVSKRPESGPVVDPLPEKDPLPADGVAWDFENVPADLVDEAWATAQYSDSGSFVKGRVTYKGVNGKGYKGSRAIEFSQVGDYNWSDEYNLVLSKDETAHMNWRVGDIFWFWIDTTQMTGKINIDVKLNGINCNLGTKYYLFPDGESAAYCGGNMPEGYNGYGFARVPVKEGYKGFVGIEISGYTDLNVKKVSSIRFHIASGTNAGDKLYLDQFVVTSYAAGPNGVKVNGEKSTKATSTAAAWNMENLPANLVTKSWASEEYLGKGQGHTDGGVQLLRAEGKGRNGSVALEIRQNTEYHWSDVFDIFPSEDTSAKTDWSTGQMIWFWIDASELTKDAEIEFKLNGTGINRSKGKTYRVLNGEAVEWVDFTDSWNGAGRINIPTGYYGFIGFPVAVFDGVTKADDIYFHLAGKGATSGVSIYIDEFWVTGMNQVPVGAENDTIKSREAYKPSADFVAKKVIDFEDLSGDLHDQGIAKDKSYPQFSENTEVVVEKKGMNATKGLVYRFKADPGEKDWAIGFDLQMEAAGADRSWDGAGMLWFYIDATGMKGEANTLDVQVGDFTLKVGAHQYKYDGTTISDMGETTKAWDTADYSRIIVPANYKGFIGVKLEDFTNISLKGTISKIYFYSHVKDGVFPKYLVIDELWLTKVGEAPNVTFTDVFASKSVLDFESLEGDGFTGEFVKNEYLSTDGVAANTLAKIVTKFGHAGTKGLQYSQPAYSGNGWAQLIRVDGEKSGMDTDWTGSEMFWFYLDANKVNVSFGLDVMVNDGTDRKITTGTTIKKWQGGDIETLGTANEGWTGAGYGRISVPANFKGFIGIPMSAFTGLNTADIKNLYFYTTANSTNYPLNVVLDDFWLTKTNEKPDLEYKDTLYESTLVIDFEDLLGDLFDQNIASCSQIANFKDYNTVKVLKEIGLNGSRGLEYAFNTSAGSNYWALEFELDLSKTTALRDWTGAEMLWMYIDTTGFKGGNVEIQIDGKLLAIGEKVYTYDGDEMKQIGTTVDRWDGNGSRIAFPASFKGFIGFKLSGYAGLDLSNISKIKFYTEASAYPMALVLDDFYLTADGLYPDVEIEGDPVPVKIHVNDMEDTLYSSLDNEWLWPINGGTNNTDVKIAQVAKKGFNGTSAIMYEKTTSGDKAAFRVREDNNSLTKPLTNLAGTDIFWFWVDASGVKTNTRLEVDLYNESWNDVMLRIGEKFYLWDGTTKTEGTTLEAWNNADRGTIDLPAEYVGFIGIPFTTFYDKAGGGGTGSAFSNACVRGVAFNLRYCNVGDTLYIDEFWATDKKSLPDVTFAGPVQIHYNDMESEKYATYDKNYAGFHWKNAADDTKAIAEQVEGKGFDGSKAIKFVHKTGDWDNVLVIRRDSWTWEDGQERMVDLSSADIIWYYVDTMEFTTDLRIEMRLFTSDGSTWWNDVKLQNGKTYYRWNGGEVEELETVASYDGSTYGAVIAPAQYKGYIGIPFDSFYAYVGSTGNETTKPLNKKYVSGLMFDLKNYNGEKALYIDDFWATDSDSLPNVEFDAPVQIHYNDLESSKYATYDKNYAGFHWKNAADETKAISAQVEGKGVNGSKGIKFVHKTGDWDNVLVIRRDSWTWEEGQSRMVDLSTADVIWYYVDTTELTSDVRIEMRLFTSDGSSWWNDVKLQNGKPYYLWDGTDKTIQETVASYDGCSYGAVVVPAKFKGYVGIPFDSFYAYVGSTGNETSKPLNKEYISGLMFDLKNYNGDKAIYLDDFWATDDQSLPDIEFGKEPVQICVNDIESTEYSTVKKEYLFSAWTDDAISKNHVGIAQVSGKGFGGSKAIEYVFKTTDWDSAVKVRVDKFSGYPKDYSAGEIIWFWIDASAIKSNFAIEFDLYNGNYKDVKPKTAGKYYLWQYGDRTEKTMSEAWNGAGYGKMALPAEYVGFVGIPYTSFPDGTDFSNIIGETFYLRDTSAGATVYLDEIWITDADSNPNVTKPVQIHVNDLESSKYATFNSNYFCVAWQSNVDSNKIEAAQVDNKGVNGSKAIKVVNKNGSWDNVVRIREDSWDADFQRCVDLSTADMIWFYVDTTEFTSAVNVEVRAYFSDGSWWDDIKLQVGKDFYLWDGSTKTKSQTVASYSGATYGAVTVQAGFKGYVGIPFDTFHACVGNNGETTSKTQQKNNLLGLLFDTKNNYGSNAIYYDDFWGTDMNSVPAVTIQNDPS